MFRRLFAAIAEDTLDESDQQMLNSRLKVDAASSPGNLRIKAGQAIKFDATTGQVWPMRCCSMCFPRKRAASTQMPLIREGDVIYVNDVLI